MPEDTYAVGYISGACIITDTYSWLTYQGTQSFLQGGWVTVAEVDGQYSFTMDGIYYGSDLKQFNGSFVGTIEGMVVPSEYTEQEPEPVDPDAVIELTPYDWFCTYGTWGTSAEFELGWYDQDGYHIQIDFRVNPIVAGTYTMGNGLDTSYCRYRTITMIDCEVEVTDAGDGQLAFDVNFRAQIDGQIKAYHFTWVGDPSTLKD